MSFFQGSRRILTDYHSNYHLPYQIYYLALIISVPLSRYVHERCPRNVIKKLGIRRVIESRDRPRMDETIE